MIKTLILEDRQILEHSTYSRFVNFYKQPFETFTDKERDYIKNLCNDEKYNDADIIDHTKPNWLYITLTMDKYFPNYEDINSKLEYLYRLVNNDPILCKYFRRVSQLEGIDFEVYIELTDDSLINQDVFFEYFKLEPCGSINDNFERKCIG